MHQRAGIEGVVLLVFLLMIKGLVAKTEILRGIPNTGLNEAAVSGIKEVSFKPARLKEKIPMHG